MSILKKIIEDKIKEVKTQISVNSDPRRDNTILNLLKTIDPDAKYAGGVGGGGDRAFIVKGKPEDYKKLLSKYIDNPKAGINITKF